MADAAKPQTRLEKLARLKSLKSGMKAARPVDEPESVDSLIAPALPEAATAAEPPPPAPAPTPEPAPQPKAAAAPEPRSAEDDDEPESLSAYFEALGFTPGTPKDGAAGTASGHVPEQPPESARDLTDEDRWQDPVRDAAPEPVAEAVQHTEPEPVQEEMRPLDGIDAILGGAENHGDNDPTAPVSALADRLDDPVEEPEETGPDASGPDFADIEAAVSAGEERRSSARGRRATDGGLSVTFDESRATLLRHVSQQMNCSVDDVVITALDWYLEALFGEDEASEATR